MLIILSVLMLLSCGKHPSPPKTELPAYYKDDIPPSESLGDLEGWAQGLRDVLVSDFSPGGQVVSLNGKDHDNIGDSRLFDGLALVVMGCEQGQKILDETLDSIVANNGQLLRYDPLPQEYVDNSNESSIDMATGVMWGLAERARKCPDDAERIKDVWRLHRDWVLSHGDRLAEKVQGYGLVSVPGFRWAWDLAGYLIGTNDKPGGKEAAEVDLIALIADVKRAKRSCYPIHLGLAQVLMATRAGHPMTKFGRWSVCQETKGLGIPLMDWFCERQAARDYLQGWQNSEWHYRHQRCSAWETPDGNGERHPGLDALIEYEVAK